MTGLPLLYTYWRSGSSHRVRIALALKGVAYESVPVNLIRDGGEQKRPEYLAVNPQGRVPSMHLPDGAVLTQSPAILEWLEETVPGPALLPADPIARVKVRAVAAIIGCDIHPLNNVAVLNMLRGQGQDEAAITLWIEHWIRAGFDAVEQLIGDVGWCFGPEPGMADVYLIPQLYAARRFQISIDRYPRIVRIEAMSERHAAFETAKPENQSDAARAIPL